MYQPGLELPPRARRILNHSILVITPVGTTSACAENTEDTNGPDVHLVNYLRVRGEYQCTILSQTFSKELPPRARRIQRGERLHNPKQRTTSACAENTSMCYRTRSRPWNYLRVRGEYVKLLTCINRLLELPPRARRIQGAKRGRGSMGGTTSACAENTGIGWRLRLTTWNYLRVRGEYRVVLPSRVITEELPPRARRIHGTVHVTCGEDGTTSACAENTERQGGPGLVFGNYLRVRGEYTLLGRLMGRKTELPPRARRIPAG